MTSESDQHTGEHHATTHHKKQSSRFLLLAVPFLLILILLTVAVSLGTKKEQQPGQYPAEIWEEAEEPGQFVGEPVQQNSIARSIASRIALRYGFISNMNDSGWKTYKPVRVQIQKNIAAKKIAVNWNFSNPLQFFPYAVLIGYSNAQFDSVQKLNPNERPNPDPLRWVIADYSDPLVFKYNDALTLDLSKLPQNTSSVYFYIYVRVGYPDGSSDYVYGSDANSLKPYIVTL